MQLVVSDEFRLQKCDGQTDRTKTRYPPKWENMIVTDERVSSGLSCGSRQIMYTCSSLTHSEIIQKTMKPLWSGLLLDCRVYSVYKTITTSVKYINDKKNVFGLICLDKNEQNTKKYTKELMSSILQNDTLIWMKSEFPERRKDLNAGKAFHDGVLSLLIN